MELRDGANGTPRVERWSLVQLRDGANGTPRVKMWSFVWLTDSANGAPHAERSQRSRPTNVM